MVVVVEYEAVVSVRYFRRHLPDALPFALPFPLCSKSNFMASCPKTHTIAALLMTMCVYANAGITSVVEGQLSSTKVSATIDTEAAYLNMPVQGFAIINYRESWFTLEVGKNNTVAVNALSVLPPPPFGTFVPAVGQTKVTLDFNTLLFSGNAFDTVDWVGLNLYVGYGKDWDDMLAKGQFKRIYPIEAQADATQISVLPLTPDSEKKLSELTTRVAALLKKFKEQNPGVNLYDEVQSPPWILWTEVLNDLYDSRIKTTNSTALPNTNGKVSVNPGNPVTLPVSSAGVPVGSRCGYNIGFYLDCSGPSITYYSTPERPDLREHTPQNPGDYVPINKVASDSAWPRVPVAFDPLAVADLFPTGLLSIKWLPWKCDGQPSCSFATPPRDMPTPETFIGTMPVEANFSSTADGFSAYSLQYQSWAYKSKIIPPLLNAGKLFFESCHLSVISQYAAHPDWTKGSYDDTRLYGLSGKVVDGIYEFKCQEEGVFYANTLPQVLQINLKSNAQIDLKGVYTYVDSQAAELKRKSKFDAAKTTANMASGFVPLYGNVNSLGKCLTGYSATDGLINLVELISRPSGYTAPLDNWQDCVAAIPAMSALTKAGLFIKGSAAPLTAAAVWQEYKLGSAAAKTFMESNKYGKVLNGMGDVKSKVSDVGEYYQALLDYLEGRCAKQAVYCK